MGKRKKPRRGAGRERKVPITPELRKVLDEAREAFIQKFGREPGPGDPVFYDPDFNEPAQIDPHKLMAEMVVSMIQADMPLHLIYGYIRTDGLIAAEQNWDLLSEEDRAEWEEAMAEFEQQFGLEA